MSVSIIDHRVYQELDQYVVKGDSLVPIEITVYDEDGNLYDLDGASVSFNVKKNKADTTSQIEKTELSGITIADSVVTIESFDVSLSAGTYYYDVTVTSIFGVVTTILKGKFIVEVNI